MSEKMKSYLGVKLIQAKPIVKDGVEGYEVHYPNPDGSIYVSFSPADVFDKYYMELDCDNKISSNDVERAIGDDHDLNVTTEFEKTTAVHIKTRTGYVMSSTSSCVDPVNYDVCVGTGYAMKNIKGKVWDYLGFMLQWARNGLK